MGNQYLKSVKKQWKGKRICFYDTFTLQRIVFYFIIWMGK
jgi:hypothetical protein